MSGIYKSAEGERAIQEQYSKFLAYWPVPNRHLRLPTRAGETFVIASGPDGAPALVLLHGSGFNSVTWMGDVATWAERYRVYSVDVIGQPGRSAPSRPRYDSEAYALWIDDVLAALGVERASFVGLSLGGWLALDYATRRPERVAALALLCPAGVGRELMSRMKLWLAVLPLLVLGRWGRGLARRRLLGATPQDRSPAAKAVAEFISLIHRHFRANLARLPRFSDAALQRLRMPVLAIVGGRDAMLDSTETRERLEANVAAAQIRFLPDVGHAVVGQAAPIVEFLSRVERA